jgi:hypothetical protein
MCHSQKQNIGIMYILYIWQVIGCDLLALPHTL